MEVGGRGGGGKGRDESGKIARAGMREGGREGGLKDVQKGVREG